MVSDSKSDVRKYRGFKSLLLRNFNDPTISQRCTFQDLGPEPSHRDAGPSDRDWVPNPLDGEVTEWPKVHDWKSCVLKGTKGSNPFFSATNYPAIHGPE